jgi:hypothetical protein
MSTYTQILYQIVFGSKDYSGFLDQENQGLLFAYIVGMLKMRNCHPYQVGGYDNHIHIVTHISNKYSAILHRCCCGNLKSTLPGLG